MSVRLYCLLIIALLTALRPLAARADTTATPLATKADLLIGAFLRPPADVRAIVPPALSVSIGRNGRLLYAGAQGEESPGHPASANSVYRIGSLTKQFTAAAILNLIDKTAVGFDGKTALRLDTPVASLLRGAQAWEIEGGPPITVQNLLTMTSNLPNFTRRPPPLLDPWGAVPARRLLGELVALHPSGYPGSFEYSNTSYFLLSEIMESVFVKDSSRHYRDILQQDLFDTAGLTHTTVVGEAPQPSVRLARPHYTRRPAFTHSDWLKGSGDVASTVTDMLRWNTALMEGRILSAQSRSAIFSDAARVDVWTYYGLGWFISHKGDRETYFHSGTVPGYTSFNLIVRKESDWACVTLLTNSDGVEGLDVLAEALAEVALHN